MKYNSLSKSMQNTFEQTWLSEPGGGTKAQAGYVTPPASKGSRQRWCCDGPHPSVVHCTSFRRPLSTWHEE